MKNIHALPTDKEPIKGYLLLRHIWKGTPNECISWWRYNDIITIEGTKQYTTLNSSFRDIVSSFKVQNIYITSDEEIKEGDWCLFDRLPKIVSKSTVGMSSNGSAKKIILTTDQDLIKDDVQAIDDEFLEWFVNNPSCEEVEVEREKVILGEVSGTTYVDFKYQIIIPKEEPKTDYISKHIEYCHNIAMKSLEKENKQETLEEACVEYAEQNAKDSNISYHNLYAPLEYAFRNGAKWQMERSYSEEDIRNMINDYDASQILFNEKYTYNQWFKQFKKK